MEDGQGTLEETRSTERPGGTTAWGSPVHAAGRIYITDQQGTTLVFAAGPKYELLATNRLDERCDASIAVSSGDLFIRTHKHLWCIGEGSSANSRADHGPCATWLYRRLRLGFLARRAGPVGSRPRSHRHQAVHRHGQTFVTWKDVAEGEAGAKFRYSLYRSDQPITADNLAKAELCYHGVLNNSAKLFGSASTPKDRLDPTKPTAPSRKAASRCRRGAVWPSTRSSKAGKAYYAVVATDEKFKPLGEGRPRQERHDRAGRGEAGADPADQALRLEGTQDLRRRRRRSPGKKGLPLHVELHGSQGQGGGAGDYGDYYLYFGTPEMGYRDGLPGVFSVEEHRGKAGNHLLLRVARRHRASQRHAGHGDVLVRLPVRAAGAKHTRAAGLPVHREPAALDDRLGRSSVTRPIRSASPSAAVRWAAWVRSTSASAIRSCSRRSIRTVGRVRSVACRCAGRQARPQGRRCSWPTARRLLRPHGRAEVRRRAPRDLPFLGWCCGRQDGYATWQEQIDMVKALTAARHGFAFSWNNGGHSEGGRAMAPINKYYPAEKFARNRSYPAFGNSSIDHKLGNGDPKDGDLEGGINLGFDWKDVIDEQAKWSVHAVERTGEGRR